MKSAGRPQRIIFYSDEKYFVVDPHYNPQNDRWIRFNDDEDELLDDPEDPDGHGDAATAAGKFIARSKHPAAIMILGAVASTGETSPPIWFPAGFRLNAEEYIKSLRTIIIPWMHRSPRRGALHVPTGLGPGPPCGQDEAFFWNQKELIIGPPSNGRRTVRI